MLATTLACLTALAVTAGSAGAAEQVDITPAGEYSASGTLSFVTDNHQIACAVTLSGTLAETSIGEGGPGLLPEVNPRIGDLQSVTWGSCTPEGASVELTGELPVGWFYKGEFEGEALMYFEPTPIHLLDPEASIDCYSDAHFTALTLLGGAELLDFVVGWVAGERSGECDTGDLDVNGSLTFDRPRTITQRTI